MHIEAPPPRRRAIVGLTPLIDVVFILLIFFMLATSFLDWRSVSLAIPPETAAPTDAEPQRLVVELEADGDILIGDDVVSLRELSSRLQAALEDDSERPVVIRPHAGVPLRQVMVVVDEATEAGVTRLSLNRGEG